MPRKSNIVLTGGHAATTALATIESLKKDDNISWNISWIGSKRAIEGKSALTLEFREFPKLGITCYGILTGRVQRRFTRFSVWSLIKIPFGFLHALYLLLKIRPDIILSFGGFAAFPVVVAGAVLRVPVIIHEQTIAAGLANRYSGLFATKIALSRVSSKKYFPQNKTVLVGNPVREEFFRIASKSRMGNPPVILATGGSRGSQIFNNLVRESLPVLLNDFVVIHQSGDLDFENCANFRAGLPMAKRKRYRPYSSIAPGSMAAMFRKADIIVGRAGANTVAEVIASRRPAVFMPIPWSQNDEQTKNARLAVATGQAVIINQDEATSEILINAIKNVYQNWREMARVKKGEIYNLDKGAADKLSMLAGKTLK